MKELKQVLMNYLEEICEDLVALCEDNEVMKETIRDYFDKEIANL